MMRNSAISRGLALAVRLLGAIVVLLALTGRASAAPSDVCNGSVPLRAMGFSESSTTTGMTNDLPSVPLACNNRHEQVAGRDAVYAFQIFGAVNNVTITVTPTTAWDPSIYVIAGCAASCQAGHGSDSGGVGAVETLTLTNLPIGTYYVVLDSFYQTGDATNRGSGDFTISIVGDAGATPTTTSVVATTPASPWSFQPFNLNATVTAGLGAIPPTGSVSFTLDGNVLGSAPLAPGSGTTATATLLVAAGVAGRAAPYPIVATFVPDSSFGASTGNGSVTVNIPSTTTALEAAPTPPSTYGDSITFTATVTPQFGSAAGTVTFFDSLAPIASDVAVVGGTATFSTANLGGGPHSITAVFTPTSAVVQSGSVSNAVSYQVNTAASSVSVVSSVPGPVLYGTSVTFTATINGGGPTPPGGTVTFFSGSTAISGAVPVVGNNATLTTSALPVASHNIRAVYSGDANYAAGEASTGFVVQPIPTTVSVASTPAPDSGAGEAVTITATINTASNGPPTGTVVFTIDANPPSAPVNVVGGVATFGAGTALTPGVHTISAVYSGSDIHSGSTGSGSHTVRRITTTIALTATPDPAVYLEPIELRATLTPASVPPFGIPGGTVEFFDGGLSLGTATLDANAVAVFPTVLPVGDHTNLTAVFGGDANFLGSTSPAAAVLVNRADTTTTIASSTNPSIASQPLTLFSHVAVVAPGGGVPAGNVSFYDGATLLGTAPLDVGGDASLTTSALVDVGNHTLRAVYAGDTNYNTSTSPDLLQAVAATGVLLEIVSSQNPAPRGTNVTFTVTATAIGAAQTPTGSVQFDIDGTDFGVQPLDATAHTASITVNTLTGGTHFVRATYSGDAIFPAGASATVLQRITAALTTTTITSSPNPSIFGSEVTFTINLTSPVPGNFTGSVLLLDGSSILGTVAVSGPTMTFKTTALTVGDHSVSATYGGDLNYAPSASQPVVQTVNRKPVVEVPDGGTSEEDAGAPLVDSGSPLPTEGGAPGGGLPQFDAGVPPGINIGGDDGGCGCQTVGAGAGSASLGVLSALGLVAAAARRRRRRD